jgi:hypothetical protein
LSKEVVEILWEIKRIRRRFFVRLRQLTVISSFRLLPLKSRCVNELEILGLSERECAI